MSRILNLRLATLAAAAWLALTPVRAEAQKALVYCPVGIDAAGCNTIVAALTANAVLFPDGVDAAYDGTSGTVDLAGGDLSGYAVFVVPSLADGPDVQPYSLLRNVTIAGRIQAAFVGRAAVWSGTPDVGSTNRTAKDNLIRNLAAWATADAAGTHGPGVVVLQDNSDEMAVRYGWLAGVSSTTVAADSTLDVYSNVQVTTAVGRTILTNSSGLQIGYANMASFGLRSLGGLTVDATGGTSGRPVLATAAGEPSDPGIATVRTDKEDYAPGETVTITGTGWEPGETVSMRLHEDPVVHGDRTLSTVADESGHIFNNAFSPEEHDVGVRFVLEATGLTSGRTAQATFTDGKVQNATIGTFTVNGSGACTNTAQTAFAQTARVCAKALVTSLQGNTANQTTDFWLVWFDRTGTVRSTSPMFTIPTNPTLPFAASDILPPQTGGNQGVNPTWQVQVCSNTNCGGVGNAHAIANFTFNNVAPVANNDAATTNEGNGIAIDVRGNDTDANGDTLTVVNLTQPPVAAGTVAVNADQTVTFTPAATFNGSTSFTYRASDGVATSNVATVTVTVTAVNDAPSFTKGADQTVNEDAGAQSVSGWATAISAGPANESSQTVSFEITANTNAALFSTQPAVSPAGTLTYTPAANAFGNATITLRIKDNGGTANGGVDASATQTFTITVMAVNDAPSFTKGADETVLEGSGAHTVTGWATAISAGPANESGQTLTFQITANTNTGLFSVQPAVSATGTLTYTLAATGSGVATVTVRLQDNGGTTNGGVNISPSQSFLITVTAANAAPVLAAIGNKFVDELVPLTFTATATDANAPPQALTFSLDAGFPAGASITTGGAFSWTPTEPQGPGVYPVTIRVSDGTLNDFETISITVNEANLAPEITGVPATATINELSAYGFDADATDGDSPAQTLAFSLIGAPAGAGINGSTGAFTWTPTEAQGPGSYPFSVRVSDGVTHTDAPITITVDEVNVPPTLTGVPATATIDELSPYAFDADATDPDVPPQGLTFGLVGAPAGAAIDGSTGAFTWTPTEAQGPGTYTFTVRVSDGVEHDDAEIKITVNEVNVPPTLTGVPATATVDELVAYTFDADASDLDIPPQGLTFSLVGAPAGAGIDPSTGDFNWTPTEAQGPGTYPFTVRVSDGVATDEAAISVTVKEVNVAPVVTDVPATAIIDELVAYSFDANATDVDIPVQTLSFNLVGAPAGATINNSTGVFAWTPSEAQGPGVYPFSVRVSDGVTQTDAAISITVNEVNVAPDLTGVPATANVDELVAYSFDADATDSDLPTQTLTFSLVGAPDGAAIDGSTGAFSWTPSEAQGPGVYPVTVRVSDGMDNTDAPISITVREVNLEPELATIADKSVLWGDLLSFSATATDPDLPANTLAFSLVSPPAGASITTGGAFTWTPTGAQIGPHTITVRVTDNGSPALHDEQTFSVAVNKRPTALAYTGSASGLYGGLIGVSAMLSDGANATPISGKSIAFTLGALSVSATTQSVGAAGVASASLTLAQNVGPYTVNSTFAEDALYLGSGDSDAFAINPAPLSIKADNKTMFFGAAAPPPFTATYTGFVLGEGTSALGGSLGFSGAATTANASTPVGPYPIIPGGQTSTNYAITFANGTLALIYNNLVGHQFLQPINPNLTTGNRSSFKIGATIPTKFQIFKADGVTPVTTAIAKISVLKLDSSPETPINEELLTMPPDDGVFFRVSGSQYLYNLGTKIWGAGTFRIIATLDDGSTITAEVDGRPK
jgi:hypothetical protein